VLILLNHCSTTGAGAGLITNGAGSEAAAGLAADSSVASSTATGDGAAFATYGIITVGGGGAGG